MKLTKKMGQVTLKMSKEEVTGKIGLSWIVHSMEHFGINEMISDEYKDKKRSNRQIGAEKKILAGAMMLASGGERVEDVEILRADKGLVNSLGWEGIIGSDTLLNFVGDRRSNAKMRRVNEAMVIKALGRVESEE